MDDWINLVAEEQKIDTTALNTAFVESEREIKAFSEALTGVFDKDEHSGIDVVLCGSIARRELTRESDCDYLVVVDNLDNHRLVPQFIREVEAIRRERMLGPTGQQGIFGEFISTAELLGRIGLEADTNLTTTRRLLLLTESVSAYAPSLRSKVIEEVLERYCADYHPDNDPTLDPIGVPRFLCNDLVRFWRTMAVDFGAKRWRSVTPDWYLRYAKLVTTRKILFAGSLISLFLTDLVASDPSGASHAYSGLMAHLKNQFDRPPLARLLSSYGYVNEESKGSLGEVLRVYNRFIEILNDRGARDLLQQSTSSSQRANELRTEVEEIIQTLQGSLEQIFFTEPVFAPITKRYGVF